MDTVKQQETFLHYWWYSPQHFYFFYLDAVKICLELVHMALMGLS